MKVQLPLHCRRSGVDDTLPAALMTIFEKAEAQGLAGKELPALAEVLLPDKD